jgi:CTP synthase
MTTRGKGGPRFIFTIGGVLSGLGKGIVTSSIAYLLKARGYGVTAIKIDPYISIDAGTMRPAEHGEVFVTDDGGEIDQDLGNYERFLNQSLTKSHNITTGKVFQSVINKERSFYYQGRDAEMIPDVVNEIKEMILAPLGEEDFVVVEIGGTTGDLENLPFLYAAREMGREYPCVYVLVSYLPFLKTVGELKTKPTQHAVVRLRETGIVPDFLVTRGEIPLDKPRAETLGKRCFVDKEAVIDDPDTDMIYRVPLYLERQGLARKILDRFGLPRGRANVTKWRELVEKMERAETAFAKGYGESKKGVRVGLIGKYVRHGADVHRDVYLSVCEAVAHAAGYLEMKPEIVPVSSEEIEKKGDSVLDKLKLDCVILPQGWGSRGTEGKIATAGWCRRKRVPFLGLCFGMQLAVVEFMRNEVGLNKANSEEIDAEIPDPVIHIMPDQKEYLAKMKYGGTIRLGGWPCRLKEGSGLERVYKRWGTPRRQGYGGQGLKEGKGLVVRERHRHRYEVNNEYRERLEKAGMIISGTSPDGKLVEAVELPKSKHPFFVGTQFHPEYLSRPLSPHPLFLELMEIALRGA